MKKSIETKPQHKPAALAALIIATAISAPAFAHEPEVKPLTMAVIKNVAYGAKVNSGKYEQAIDRITRNGSRAPDSFAEQVNLCVAYTKIKEIEKASTACDAAIALAKARESRVAQMNSDRSPAVRASRSDLAVALSNRGVLLAATGDAELARKDFLTAINFRTDFSKTVAANLDRLDKMRRSRA